MSYRKCRSVILAALIGLLPAMGLAQSNIDPDSSFAWGENVGWITLYPSETNGVLVTENYLSGFAWGENVGWIFFGDGPDDNTAYTNTGTDHGVNNDGSGALSGFAWGENVGWINFDTSGVGASQVMINMTTGEFNGFAWGENIGWVNFGDGYTDGVRFIDGADVSDWFIFY